MNNPMKRNRMDRPPAGEPRLVAIASGKGGVGKSVIAYNLAHSLSRTADTLLIDSDFQMGNLHLLGNVAPKQGWQDYCRGRAKLDEATVPVADRLDLVASQAGNPEEILPDIRSLAGSLSDLRRNAGRYEFVVIDTASGILPHTVLVLNAVDEVVLVTTPELTSISDCYALYKILITNNRNISASILINRENRENEIRYIYEKFVAITDQFLGHSPSFFGSLIDDPVLVESVARQRGVLELSSDSDIAGQFRALAEGFRGRVDGASFEPKTINSKPARADIRE